VLKQKKAESRQEENMGKSSLWKEENRSLPARRRLPASMAVLPMWENLEEEKMSSWLGQMWAMPLCSLEGAYL